MAEPLPSFEDAVGLGATAPPSSSTSQAGEGGGFRTTFACMTRFNVDHLHFADFPQEEVEGVQACIQRVWHKGVLERQRSPTPGGWDIKIGAFPWSAVQCGLGGDGRVLLAQVLEHLYNRGWVMHSSVMAFQHGFYGDTLIFRHQLPPPPPCEWLVIAFEKHDRLKVMPPPPKDLQASLTKWLGAQVQKVYAPTSTHQEFKLNGLPWHAMADQGVRTHLVLLRLMDALQTTGWALYGGVGLQLAVLTDVLVVHRQLDWKPGQPVWQR